MIRPAVAADLLRLREIAVDAKSHWGGDAALLERWIAQGDFSAQLLAEKIVTVAEHDGHPVAWSSLNSRGDVWWLDDLWVAQAAMGRGLGSQLFRRAAEVARAGGAVRLEWEADPGAVGFYEKMGGAVIGESPGDPLFQRPVPIMALPLRPSAG